MASKIQILVKQYWDANWSIAEIADKVGVTQMRVWTQVGPKFVAGSRNNVINPNLCKRSDVKEIVKDIIQEVKAEAPMTAGRKAYLTRCKNKGIAPKEPGEPKVRMSIAKLPKSPLKIKYQDKVINVPGRPKAITILQHEVRVTY